MRVLVVEDEHKLARAIKRALELDKYAVDVSHRSDDALAMASTEPYDIIILDRMLPGSLDGVGILETLRKQGNHTPVLFLTALGATNDKISGLDAGADDYLVKPFAIDELLARVRALLRRPHDQTDTTLIAGPLKLDTSTHVVTHGGNSVSLTAKEFALLEYLLRNQDRVVTKDTIISHVWNYDADILPNNVEAYIKHLRAKVDRPFKTRLIKTIRGFGYKLSAKEG